MGACIVAAARLSYERMKQAFFEQSSEGFCIAMHAYRQDARNGKAKVSALEFETLYVSGLTADCADKVPEADFTHVKFLSDLAPVRLWEQDIAVPGRCRTSHQDDVV